MKKKMICYFIILVTFLFSISISSVDAVTIKSTGDYNLNNQVWGVIKKTSKGTEAYCAEFYKNPPINKSCEDDTKWDINSRNAAVVGYIATRDWTYRWKEVLLNYYLGQSGLTYSCNSKTCVSGVNSGTRGKNGQYPYIYIGNLSNNNTFKDCVKKINSYEADLPKNSASVSWEKGKKLKYNKAAGEYRGVLKVYNMGLTNQTYSKNKYTVAFNKSGCKVYDSISIGYNPTSGNQRDSLYISCPKETRGTVEITITSEKILASDRYDCGKKYQKLVLEERKYREINTKVDLIPPPAENSPSDECENDDPACQCKLDFKQKVGESNNRYERIKLYKEYQDQDQDYNNLLNFAITEAEEACTGYEPENDVDIDCLTAEYLNDDFNENNLSAYDTIIDFGGNIAYCANLFNLSSEYTDTFNSGLSAIAGNPLFQTTTPKAVTMTSKMKCYLYGEDLSEPSVDRIGDQELSKKVELIYQNDDVITKGNIRVNNSPVTYSTKDGYDYYSFEKEMEEIYNFKKINFEILTGKNLLDTSYPIINTEYYGIVSKFTDVTENGKMDFKITYKGKEKTASCPYITEDGSLILNNKIQLEFRTIDTKNPFLGRLGNNTREVGSNWCETDEEGNIISCSGNSEENKTIKNNITNKNNSYNKTNEGVKYKITLTPSTIKNIRDHNKETSYDDINLKCENDVCISNYLTKLKNDGLLSINNSENRSKVRE